MARTATAPPRDQVPPVAISGGHTWSSLSAGTFGTCGISAGAAYCWGVNDVGEVGDTSTTQRTSPTLVSGGYTWSSISEGYKNSCGLTNTGVAYCWGMNNSGQIGDGTWFSNRLVPTTVSGGYTWSSISSGAWADQTCGIRNNSVTYCWGINNFGQIGDGSTTGSLTPVVVTGSHVFTSIVAGGQHACAITNLGVAFCWGSNSNGQLGDGTTTNRTSPNSTYFIASTVTVSAIVDPSFTFTVAGRSSSCNGQAGNNFQTGATATSVSLGHLNATNVGGGAQDLSIATNAANGFTVYVRTSGATPNSLRENGSGHSIADVSGTNASPGSAPSTGTEGFGYTSSDTSTPFTSNTWTKLTNTNDSVLISSGGVQSKSSCVGYEVAIGATTPAGSYSSAVVYTAVPSF